MVDCNILSGTEDHRCIEVAVIQKTRLQNFPFVHWIRQLKQMMACNTSDSMGMEYTALVRGSWKKRRGDLLSLYATRQTITREILIRRAINHFAFSILHTNITCAA